MPIISLLYVGTQHTVIGPSFTANYVCFYGVVQDETEIDFTNLNSSDEFVNQNFLYQYKLKFEKFQVTIFFW